LGPYFQGALMQHIDHQYATELHASAFKPYSQTCTFNNQTGAAQWTICTLTSTAQAGIIEPVRQLQVVRLSAPNATFEIASQTLEVIPTKQLISEIHTTDTLDYTVEFTTPTAFKSQGEYIFMPTVRLVFQNLLMHFNKIAEGVTEPDQDTLEYISQHTKITSYRLSSKYFANVSAGKAKIPAFVGTVKFHVDNVGVLPGFVGMLLKYGEFCGTGIKTAMGMGGLKIVRK
jgi:CRISPR-associated endoribonuclease Cas6